MVAFGVLSNHYIKALIAVAACFAVSCGSDPIAAGTGWEVTLVEDELDDLGFGPVVVVDENTIQFTVQSGTEGTLQCVTPKVEDIVVGQVANPPNAQVQVRWVSPECQDTGLVRFTVQFDEPLIADKFRLRFARTPTTCARVFIDNGEFATSELTEEQC